MNILIRIQERGNDTKVKRILSMMLTTVLLMGTSTITNATEIKDEESPQLLEAVSNLKTGYSEYYDIMDAETTLCSSDEINGNIENIYLLEMEVVLKADSVEQMDYFQGIESYYEMAEENVSRINSEDSRLRMKALSCEKECIYEELQEYIGKQQNLIFYIKEIYPIDNESNKEILFENGMDYVSWEVMLPSGHEELQKNGYARMASIEDDLIEEDTSLQQARASYSVDDAVDYMLKYTSNASSCNICGKGKCSNKVDTTKYNSAYTHYISVGKHVDCANYVSQALYEGGISTDDTWKAGSSAWIGVSALTKYMTDNKYWTSLSYSSVKRGI